MGSGQTYMQCPMASLTHDSLQLRPYSRQAAPCYIAAGAPVGYMHSLEHARSRCSFMAILAEHCWCAVLQQACSVTLLCVRGVSPNSCLKRPSGARHWGGLPGASC